jgi:hypothetical protein
MKTIRCIRCGKQLIKLDNEDNVFWCDDCDIDYYIREIGGNKETSYINIQMMWSK